MKFASGLWALILRHVTPSQTGDTDVGIEDGNGDVRQVAIIGAGAAGSSAAYHMSKFAEEDGVRVNITLFEKTDHIGGRTLTVNPYDDPIERVELGASIFVQINHILWNATQEFNLSLQDFDSIEDSLLVIWDGEKVVFQQDGSSSQWWNLAKLFWKYGLAAYRAQKLVQETIAKFLKLYDAPHFPFTSLTSAAYDLELQYVTGQTGEQYLTQNQITKDFSHDIIQSSTRVNYASNLAKIHGLDTMVAMAPAGASQVAGGNWQIFHNMVLKSGAYVQLNTSVAGIQLDKRRNKPRRYAINTLSSQARAETEQEAVYPVAFDDVVMANPYQFSSIKLGQDVLEQEIDEIPYVRLHVTIFTSPFTVLPEFVGLKPGTKIPTTILTTLAPGDDASSGSQGAGKAGFYSISTLKTTINPKTGGLEYVYKIFSPEKVTPALLTKMFGVEVPETFTGVPPVVKDDESSQIEPVSWYYPHVFNSYPKALPRVTFQDPILGDGLYYTSGIESFISTMETSALMGRNVARLIVDSAKASEESRAGSDTEHTPLAQSVMDEL